jgi:hypothetical protein
MRVILRRFNHGGLLSYGQLRVTRSSERNFIIFSVKLRVWRTARAKALTHFWSCMPLLCATPCYLIHPHGLAVQVWACGKILCIWDVVT